MTLDDKIRAAGAVMLTIGLLVLALTVFWFPTTDDET
jgi:hypothetical protein